MKAGEVKGLETSLWLEKNREPLAVILVHSSIFSKVDVFLLCLQSTEEHVDNNSCGSVGLFNCLQGSLGVKVQSLLVLFRLCCCHHT